MKNCFLGWNLEENLDCATNEISSPRSPLTSNSSVYSLQAKRRFLNFMSPVKSPSISKSPLKIELIGKNFFKLKI